MKIEKVRIVGFKSFADPTEYEIGPGITAIVGPNGCGKSNLIEAFRWGMGETSSKRIRADGMDDVIFGGTETRPARASCEVAITLAGNEDALVSDLKSGVSIDVIRRLDRGDGSSYKINGKAARARDVQVLFQDAGAGAGSAALVSQGKVGAIINSKPSERRSILEEAAGVAGLSARRNEAEIKLRATEQNLERAEDLEKGLNDQLSSLRRQARQAARKKSIDDLIRIAEAMAFLVRWRASVERAAGAANAHAANEEIVGKAILGVRSAEADVARIEQEVAPAIARRQEAETAHAICRTQLEVAEKAIASSRTARANAKRGVERAQADLDRERTTVETLAEEMLELADRKLIAEDDRDHDGAAIEEAGAIAFETEEEVNRLLNLVEEMAASTAASEAGRKAAELRRSDAARRRDIVRIRKDNTIRMRDADNDRLAALGPRSDELTIADEALSAAEALYAILEEKRQRSLEVDERVRTEHAEAVADLAALRSELRALSVATSTSGAVSEASDVDAGMEAAFAAALGDGLNAGFSKDTARWWNVSPHRISPPHGTRPLSDAVRIPEALLAAVSGVGVVETDADAETLAAGLQPGQSIVSSTGRLWRWDGYRSSGEENAAEEVRRATRVRALAEQEPKLIERELAATAARDEARAFAEQTRQEAINAAAQTKLRRSELEELRRRTEREERERIDVESRLKAHAGTLEVCNAELSEAEAELAVATTELQALPPADESISALDRERRNLAEARARFTAARTEHDRVQREAGLRQATIDNIVRSMEDAKRRKSAAEALCAEMSARVQEALREEEKLTEIENDAPRIAEDAREQLNAAAAFLVEVSHAANDSDKRLSVARAELARVNEALTQAREDRARLLAELKAAKDATDELSREIGERMGCSGTDLPGIAGVAEEDELPDLASCELRVSKLIRERDTLGVVNPLAEQQVSEMEIKLGDANRARDELREAVSRLRRTISDFDREARTRLTDAFGLIDGHFRDLYTRLFGGGHAHLRLSGSEDILDAGLEIYACPPGKKLQTMSLLSGGEQALAALALIFAAFLVKPAPVCVLDEVDAPLDDANVNRLCSLVKDMARDDATRFLVVTHHPLTMARADRLYGVTMAERGVSRLTHLDMESAAAFVGS